MPSSVLIFPMAAYVGWIVLLYVLLTVVRLPTAWSVGARADGSNPWAALEKRVSANLTNQFEWPLLFYVVCLLLIQLNAIDSTQVLLAWIFIAGRIVHTGVHLSTSRVRLRGLVFTINFVAVLLMWIRLLLVHV